MRTDRFLFGPADKQRLEDIVAEFGVEPQVEMAIEEMAELTVALQHDKRGRGGSQAITEEIADVILICQQLASIYGWDEVHSEIDFKFRQCDHRVETGEWNANLDADASGHAGGGE